MLATRLFKQCVVRQVSKHAVIRNAGLAFFNLASIYHVRSKHHSPSTDHMLSLQSPVLQTSKVYIFHRVSKSHDDEMSRTSYAKRSNCPSFSKRCNLYSSKHLMVHSPQLIQDAVEKLVLTYVAEMGIIVVYLAITPSTLCTTSVYTPRLAYGYTVIQEDA